MNNQKFLLSQLQNYISETENNWNYITPSEFYNNYYMNSSKADSYILLDLRKKEVYNKYHINGAKNIFWLDLLTEKNLKRLQKYKNKIIFLICYVGHTSSQAMVLLKLLGFKVISIKYGYGISPIFEIPIAGWLQFNYPVIST